MAASVTVNLRAIRKQLGTEIAGLEKAVALGEKVLEKGKSERRTFSGSAREREALARKAKKNQATLSKAKKMLKTLLKHEQSMADECCDKQIQNCELLYL